MPEQVLVLQKKAARLLRDLSHASIPESADEAVSFYNEWTHALWVLLDSKLLVGLPGTKIDSPRQRRLVVLRSVKPGRRRMLESYFKRVVTPDDETRLLHSQTDLLEALTAPNRSDLIIGGAVDAPAKAVILIRGNLDSLVVRFDWFSSTSGRTRPNFKRFDVTDSGQTVRLGDFEASTDAILYDHDPEYRRRAKRRALELDDSFGAALRRLRLMRGLAREDFRDLSAKEVARIERGEVAPREATKKKLAKALKVKPDEILTY
jgi:hypothetical protein